MKMNISHHPGKSIPERTCIACRQVKDKRDLVRLVSSGGDIEVDITGKRVGRGAYLCPESACWEAGLKGDRLERSLRTTLTPENRDKLLKVARGNFKI